MSLPPQILFYCRFAETPNEISKVVKSEGVGEVNSRLAYQTVNRVQGFDAGPGSTYDTSVDRGPSWHSAIEKKLEKGGITSSPLDSTKMVDVTRRVWYEAGTGREIGTKRTSDLGRA